MPAGLLFSLEFAETYEVRLNVPSKSDPSVDLLAPSWLISAPIICALHRGRGLVAL